MVSLWYQGDSYRASLMLVSSLCGIFAVFHCPTLRAVEYTYDVSGRLSSVIYDNGVLTKFKYSVSGNLESQVWESQLIAQLTDQTTLEHVLTMSGQDSDRDGLSDLLEAQIKTDSNHRDTDGDGLEDAVEYNVHKTNPKSSDSDGDGYSDFDEVQAETNPNDQKDIPKIDPETWMNRWWWINQGD